MKIIKYIKWFFILSFLFLFSILAMPFFCVAVWANTEQTQYFLQLLGKSIVRKFVNDTGKVYHG